ncbi:phage tail protein [Geothrix sp. PMB-07]|uniref:phage tail protein n=1 Tax=Geothrix sp. PMB-07 TaxID=3068640 RepID=UPI0027428E67|nr:phage tail protein [Geothrix sp. PMB-07]WLT30764.1 phage tail protein [Geothrix sp. PMB-07]
MLRPKPKVENAKAAGTADFDFPTATEDRRKAFVFGTVKLDSPNVTWWGDIANRPIRQKAGKGGFMGTGSTLWQTVGYRYYVGMKLSLCLGPVELLELQADGKTFWTGVSTGGLIHVSSEGLFGGETGGGGLAGTFNFLPGTMSQPVDDYLVDVLGAPLPAWRGVATLVWQGPSAGGDNGYLGTSPRIPPISAVVRRLPSNLGFGSSTTNLNGDANAAEVIYEVLTSQECGMAQPVDLVDIPSFQAAAQQLASEGFGISGIWESGDARSFIEEILRTIDGCNFLDFSTGKWRITLARGGYNVATLPVLDGHSSIQALEGYSEVALDESTNQVQVSYTSRASNFSTKQVQAQAFANIRYQDAVVNASLSYPMISKASLAAKVADRDLRAYSTPLAKGDLICTRVARTLRPGDLFVLRWAPLGIDQVVCRVLKISRGDLQSSGIRISFLKDVFSLGSALYGAPASSGWVDPGVTPQPCEAQALMEAPYWAVGASRQVFAIGSRADQVTLDAEIWTNEGAGYLQTGNLPSLTPTGLLTSAYGCKTAALDPVGFTVSGGSDLAQLPGFSTNSDGRARGANLAYFPATGELVSWTTAVANVDGSFTVSAVLRGVIDTVPSDNAAGDRVWFFSVGAAEVRSSDGSGGGGAVAGPSTPGINVTCPREIGPARMRLPLSKGGQVAGQTIFRGTDHPSIETA